MAGKYSLTLQLQLQSPQNVAQIVTQLQKQLGAVAVNVQVKNAAKATQQINQLTSATNNASNAAAKLGDAFGVSLKRFAAFSLASRAIGVFTRGLAGAIDSAIEFQNELVKISQITGENLNELGKLTSEITNLATTFGVASNEILSVTNILAQAGIKANDLTIAIRTLTKTKLAPTFGDIQDTAEGAVALIAQFGEGVGALERQFGAVNRVAAEFAVESEDLIEVIRRTGGVFKASGGDLEELLALFTSVRATTRESAESIATALKTIFTRIQRPETIQYLRQFGIELVDLNGKFVGPYEAVRRLSAELGSLGEGDIRFISIAEELGGYRQIGKVIPLLRQFETAERARQVAIESGNSLNEDAAKAQQSLAVQFTKTREKFLALIRGLSETSSFQILVKTSLNLANALISVADALKPIIPLVATLAAVKFAGNIGSFFGAVGGAFTRKQFGGKIHKFASGGVVPGSGNRDTVPAMLTPGEFVIRKSSVKKLGAGRLAAMNNNRYATGGVVGFNSTKPYVRSKLDTFNKDGTKTVKEALDKENLRFNSKDSISADIIRKPINIDESYKGLDSYNAYRQNAGKAAKGSRDAAKRRGKAFENLLAEKGLFTQEKGKTYSRLDGIDTAGMIPVEVKSTKEKVSDDVILDKLAGAIVNERSDTDKRVAQIVKGQKLTSKPEEIKFDNVYLYEDTTKELSQNPKPKKFFGGAIQKFNLGSKVSQTTRRVGYIDSDVLADPANAGIVTPEMEKLGITSIPDYMMYLAKMAAAARKTGELGRFRVVAAMAGAGKSTLMLGGQNNPKIKDDASLRNTTRFPILRPTDISRASEVITATATVTQEKLDNFIKAADKTYVLSSSTKEERQEIKRRRGVRNTSSNMATAPAGAANTLFGRDPGTTDSAPTDSASMEAMLGANLANKKLRVLGIQENKRARIKRENEQVETLKKEIGLFYGSFSPTTVGHQSMMDAAIASGISPQDFLVLVGSNEALNTKDPHSFRTAVFDQDFRALMAQSSFGARGAMISKKGNRDFGIPSAMEISAGASGRRRFVVPAVGSTAFVAGKDDKASKKYTDAGYKVQDVARDEGNVSGSIARDAILGGNMAEMQRLLSPEVFDVVQKNLGQLRNRAEVLPKIIENVRKKEVASLSEIEAKLANLPARIDKKKVAADPEYAKLAEQVVEIRKRRDKIKSSGAIKPFKLIDKLAKRYPEKYGLKRFATGGMVPGTGNRDTVPAMLTPGEFVIRKSSVAKIGPENLAAMNSGGAVQRFVTGGDVKQQIIAIKDEDAARSNKPLPSREALRSASTTRNKVKVSEVLRDDEEFYSKGEAKNQTNLEKLQAYKKNSGAKKYGGAFLYSPSSRPPSNLVGTINPQILAEEATKGLLTNKNSINNFKSTYPLSEPIRIEAGILNEDIRENFENGLYDGIVSTIQNSAKQLEAQTSIDLFTAQGNRRAAEILGTSNIEQTIGNIYEASLKNAGGYFDEKKRNANFDFPGGLGVGVGKNFTNRYLENLPTDAKATYSSDLVRNLLEKIENNKREQISERLSDAIKSGQRFATGGIVRKLWFGGEATNNIKYSFARVLEAKKKLSDKQLQKIRKSMLVGSDVSIGAFKDPNRVTSSGTLAKFTGGFYDPINKSVELNPENMSRYMARHELGHAKAYELAELQARELYSDNPKILEQKLADLKRNPVDASEISGVTGRNITGMQTAQNAIAQLLQQSYKNHVAYDNNIDYRTRPQELFADALAKVPSEVRKILTSSTKTDVVYNALLDYWDKNPGPIRGLADISPDEIGWRYGRAPQNRKPVIGKKIKSIAEPKVKMASGGAAPSDTVPALLTPGEFVFSKKSAQRIGYGNLNRMNKRGVAGYAKGGAVAVQKFNNGTGSSGVQPAKSGGGQDGFSLFNDRMFQASIGLSTLTGMLGNTETAFGRVVNYVGSFGAAVTSAITAMNAFGASTLFKSFKSPKIDVTKIFGRGAGGAGDIIGGFRGRKGQRKTGEGFLESDNYFRTKRRELIDRQKTERESIGQSLRGLRGIGFGDDDPQIQQLLERKAALKAQFKSQFQELQPKSLTGQAGQFFGGLSRQSGVKGLIGRGAISAAGSIAASPIAPLLTSLTSLAGPIAAAATAYTVINGALAAAIDAQGRYTKSVEKGDVVNAQYYAQLKEAPGAIQLLDQLFNSFGSSFSAFSTSWNYLASFLGGPSVTYLKENAKAQALSAKYTEENAKVQERISTLLNDLQSGVSTKSATQALSETGASSVGYGRELTAQIEQSTLNAQSSELNNRATGIGYLARSSIASLGGGLFGMETSNTRNTRIEAEARKQSTEAINKNREAFQQLFPVLTKSAQEYIIAGKGAEEFINKMLADGKIRKLDERSKTKLTSLRTERDTELAAGRSLSAEKEIELKALEAIDQEFESTLKMFKQQEKAIEENRKYIESLSFGFRNINSAAQATSLGLEMLAGSVETGFNAFDNAAKQLEAALSNVGQSMNPQDVENAMGTLAQTLAGYGASQQEIDRATNSFGALYTAQTEAQGALESLKTTMLQNPTGVAPEKLRENFKAELSSRLQAQGVAQPEIDRIVNSLNGLDLSSTEVLNKIKSGDLGAFTEEAFAPLREALTKETLGPLQERAKQESVLINLTKQRIDLEKAAIDARKQAIDIELESRKAIEEFGGPVVKSSQKLKALNDKLNLNLGSVGVRGLRTGASTELADTQTAIRSGFNSLQRRQNTAVALNGTGAFSGAAGVNEDKRQQLEEAQQSLIEYSRQRLDLIREEIEIAKKKNELEKSAAEKLISGDVEGFIQSQQAAAAASILRTGDESLAKLFSPTALGEAFKSLEGQGLTSAQMQSAARTALSPVGGTTRMSQVLTGTTPELESLKAEGRNVANVLGEAGKGFADMQQMKVTAQEVVITAAQVKMGEQMNVAPSQSNLTQNPIMGFMKGGLVYANRGIFVPRGTDTVPAMLSPGEFVVNAKSAQQNLGLLSAINGGAQTLSKGGVVYAQQGGFNAAPGVKTYTRDGEEWYNNSAYQYAKMGLSFAGPLSILSDFMDIGEGVYDISEGKLGKGLGKIAMGGTFALINALTGGFGGGLLKAGLRGGIGAAKMGRRGLGALRGTKLAKGIGGKIGDIGSNIAGRFKDAKKAKMLAKIDKLGLGDKQKAMLLENMFGGGRAARKGRADATKFMDTMAAKKAAPATAVKKPTKAPTQAQIDEAFRVYSGKNKKGVFTGSYIDARNKKAYSAAGKELTGASASNVMQNAIRNQKQGIRFTSKGSSIRKQSDGTMLGFSTAGDPMNATGTNALQKTFMARSKTRKASGQLTQSQAKQAARQQKMGKLLDEADAEEAAKMAKMADAESLVTSQTSGGGIMNRIGKGIENFANTAQPTTRAGRMRSGANAIGGGLIRTGARSMFGTAPGIGSSIGLDQGVTAAGLEQEMKDRGITGGTPSATSALSRPPVQSRPMLRMPQVSARDVASRPMLSPLQQSQGMLSSAMRRDAARSAGAIAGGVGAGGISSETVAMLTSAFDSFAESVQTLQSMQISVKLDATNINVNFNGASFLANLTDEVRKGVLTQVKNEIENQLVIGNNGRPQFQPGGMV